MLEIFLIYFHLDAIIPNHPAHLNASLNFYNEQGDYTWAAQVGKKKWRERKLGFKIIHCNLFLLQIMHDDIAN